MRFGRTSGEARDNRLCSALLTGLKLQTKVLADCGYDADWMANISGNAIANAICFSPLLYRARNLMERFFNRLEYCPRIATRYDKLAANHLAFVQLASIRLWLRVHEFTT